MQMPESKIPGRINTENDFARMNIPEYHFPNSRYRKKISRLKVKQGGKGVLVLPNTKDMTRSTKLV